MELGDPRMEDPADDLVTETERLGLYDDQVEWAVHAQSYDLPGPGYVVSMHPNRSDALTECVRLNRANMSDAGSYTIRPVTD